MNRRILVLEDDSMMQETIVSLLKGYGFDVTTFDNPQSALEAARQFDIIHTDGNLPGMTGVAFTREARAMNPDALIYMLSGEKAFEEGFLRAGGNLFIHKLDLKHWMGLMEQIAKNDSPPLHSVMVIPEERVDRSFESCPTCSGNGRIVSEHPELVVNVSIECPACEGTGQILTSAPKWEAA